MLSSLPCAYRSFNVTFDIPVGDSFTLIIKLLTAAETQFDLRPSPFEVKLEGDQGQPLGFHPADKLIDLSPVEQQFAAAHRFVVVAIAVFIDGDVGVL